MLYKKWFFEQIAIVEIDASLVIAEMKKWSKHVIESNIGQ